MLGIKSTGLFLAFLLSFFLLSAPVNSEEAVCEWLVLGGFEGLILDSLTGHGNNPSSHGNNPYVAHGNNPSPVHGNNPSPCEVHILYLGSQVFTIRDSDL